MVKECKFRGSFEINGFDVVGTGKARLSQNTSWLQSLAQVRWANCILDFYIIIDV